MRKNDKLLFFFEKRHFFYWNGALIFILLVVEGIEKSEKEKSFVKMFFFFFLGLWQHTGKKASLKNGSIWVRGRITGRRKLERGDCVNKLTFFNYSCTRLSSLWSVAHATDTRKKMLCKHNEIEKKFVCCLNIIRRWKKSNAPAINFISRNMKYPSKRFWCFHLPPFEYVTFYDAWWSPEEGFFHVKTRKVLSSRIVDLQI